MNDAGGREVILRDIIIAIPKHTIAALLASIVVVLSPVAVYAQDSTHKEDLHIGTPVGYITFNQYVDNAVWGDEHDFVRVGPTSVESTHELKDYVVAVEGQEYYVYMYVHNNAASSLNLIATGARIRLVDLHTSADITQQLRGFIDVDNIGAKQDGNGGQTTGSAGTFWDECGFQSMDGRKFTMQYVLGSAVYINNAGTFKLPDTVVAANGENPALIGYTTMNGKIPGCGNHIGSVIIRVKPIYEQEDETPGILTTLIKRHDSNSWGTALDITKADGNLIDVKVVFNNTSAQSVENVSLRAMLGDYLSYVDGSLRLSDLSESGNIAHGNPSEGDVLIGSYEPGETATLEYQVTIKNDIDNVDIVVKNEVSFSDTSGNTQTNGSRAFISMTSIDAHVPPTDITEAVTTTMAAEWSQIISVPFVVLGGVATIVGAITGFIKHKKAKKQTAEKKTA